MFYQLKVNGINISWERIYGTALGVQKYTTTHVVSDSSGSVSSRINTITEFWLKEGNGRETQIKLFGHKVKVREGQRVSAIWAYTKSETSSYIIFVNHDFQDWCWVCTPTSFFSQLEMFRLLPRILVIYILAVLPTILVFLYFLHYYFFLVTLVGVIVILIILLQLIQWMRIFLTWKSMQSEIANIIKTLI